MDDIDQKIVQCLLKNARMTASLIGQEVNLSVSAVSERIKRLEKLGVIKGYTVRLDESLLGRNVCAFICVSVEHSRYNESFMQAVLEHPQIDECQYVTGDFDFLVKVRTESMRQIERVLSDVRGMGGVSFTRTLVVLSTVKQEGDYLGPK